MKVKTKKQSLIIKKLECTQCGCIREIPRKLSRNKKTGHYKHMFCPTCNEKTKYIELYDI